MQKRQVINKLTTVLSRLKWRKCPTAAWPPMPIPYGWLPAVLGLIECISRLTTREGHWRDCACVFVPPSIPSRRPSDTRPALRAAIMSGSSINAACLVSAFRRLFTRGQMRTNLSATSGYFLLALTMRRFRKAHKVEYDRELYFRADNALRCFIGRYIQRLLYQTCKWAG